MLPSETIDALRFLAMSQTDKTQYLCAATNDSCYLSDDGAEISFASEAGMRAAFKALDSGVIDASGETRQLLLEVRCVVEMLLDLAGRIDYFWTLDKGKSAISGPYDDAWLVLRRLALLALNESSQAVSFPTLAFEEFIKNAGFRRVGKNSSS